MNYDYETLLEKGNEMETRFEKISVQIYDEFLGDDNETFTLVTISSPDDWNLMLEYYGSLELSDNWLDEFSMEDVMRNHDLKFPFPIMVYHDTGCAYIAHASKNEFKDLLKKQQAVVDTIANAINSEN